MKRQPKILARRVLYSSPWMQVLEKDVDFMDGSGLESYCCITQAPYVSVLAQTPAGLIPLVRQFRPCVEDYTWEFPGGTLDPGESAEEAARRELREEAGLRVIEFRYLGNFYPDTGRLQLDSHAFYARTTAPDKAFVPEKGMAVRFVAPSELKQMMLCGEFRPQLHLALYAAVHLHAIDLDFSTKNKR